MTAAPHDIRWRASVAFAAGAVFGSLTLWLITLHGPSYMGGDWTYTYAAARAVLAGQNPYEAVQGSAIPFGGRLYYPMTAAIVSVPLAWLPPPLGGALLVGLSAGVLSFVVTRKSWWPLLILASGPMFAVVTSVQWSAFVAFAAFAAPAIGIAGAVKPNLALSLLALQSNRRAFLQALLVGSVILVISILIRPGWPLDWLRTLRTSPAAKQYWTPLFTLWGAPLWVAAVRWRDPRARFLFCMAAVPQTGFLYDQLPLLLVARTRAQLLVGVVCSWLVVLAPMVLSFNRTNNVTLSRAYVPIIVGGLYWPALLLVFKCPCPPAVARVDHPAILGAE